MNVEYHKAVADWNVDHQVTSWDALRLFVSELCSCVDAPKLSLFQCVTISESDAVHMLNPLVCKAPNKCVDRWTRSGP